MKDSTMFRIPGRMRLPFEFPAIVLVFLLSSLFLPATFIFAENTSQPVNETDMSEEVVVDTNEESTPPAGENGEGVEVIKKDQVGVQLTEEEQVSTELTEEDEYTPWNKTENNKPRVLEDGNGAFSYLYPIKISPIRKDVIDFFLSLNYNSQNTTDSVLGYGWNLSIPSIERINKTGTQNLFNETYFRSSISGDLVQDENYYFAQSDGGSFMKYALADGAWTAKDKNGVVYKFGETSNSRQDDPNNPSHVYKWMLSSVTSPNENIVNYTYSKDSGQIFPDSVFYNYNNGEPLNTIVFQKELITDPSSNTPTRFNAGFGVQTRYLINQIEIKENDSWVRRYDFDYTSGDAGSRQLLSSITESGKSMETGVTTTFPATTFGYKTFDTYEWQETTNSEWEPPLSFAKENPNSVSVYLTQVLDLNGDTYPDFIREDCDLNVRHIIGLNDADGTWTNLVNSLWSMPECIKKSGDHGIDNGVRFVDINGDLYPDFIRSVFSAYASPGDYTPSSWRVFMNVSASAPPNVSMWDEVMNINPLVGFTDSKRKSSRVKIADINGDGLSDFLYSYNYQGTLKEGVILATGTGYEEAPEGYWNVPRDMFTTDDYDDSAIEDLNGDGLADLIWFNYIEDDRETYINTGTNWVLADNYFPSNEKYYVPVPVSVPYIRRDGGVRFSDLNGDNIVDSVFSRYSNSGRVDIGTANTSSVSDAWNEINYSGGSELPEAFTTSNGRDWYSRLVDINGDGLQDFIRFYEDDSQDEIHTHLGIGSSHSDILETILVSEGGQIDIEYTLSSQYKDESGNLLNPYLPLKVLTVSKITTNDGLGNNTINNFVYADGHYYFRDSLHRKFAGFATVDKTDIEGNVIKTYFHQGDESNTALGEYEDHPSKIGMPYRVEEYDNVGSLYRLTVNKIDKINLGTDHNFVKKVRQTILSYDGGTAHKDTAEEYAYEDTFGNLTEKISWGEVTANTDGSFVDVGTDKAVENISYATNVADYIVGLPSSDAVLDQAGNKVRESKIYYDGLALGEVDLGNPTKNEQWKENSVYMNTEKKYNNYGLVTEETDANGNITYYDYDSYNLYPASVTNTLDQATSYLYDYVSGQVTEKTDSNNFTYRIVYDGLVRLIEEYQPDPENPSSLVLKTSYVYIDIPGETSVQKTSYLDEGTSTDMYIYFDGLGRKVQEKKVEENGYLTKDYEYNDRGFLDKESLPYNSGEGTRTAIRIIDNPHVSYTYDSLGRVLTETNDVGTTSYSYSPWKTTIIDTNGKVKRYYNDAYGNLIKVEELNGTEVYATNYEWNLNKNLTKTTDALGNVRNFSYDGLGRRITADDLHALDDTTYGVWFYSYDDAGNLIESMNPNGEITQYAYDELSRILTEDYIDEKGIEIIYTYDMASNGIGKLASVEMPDTSTSYAYDVLGNVVSEIKNINGTDYETDYVYDRQGNILEITNPDGSQVRYTYNSAGLPNQVERKEVGDSDFAGVVDYIEYSPAEQLTIINYANGVTTENIYNPDELYRLVSKTTVDPDGVRLQDLTYTYDPLGNITRIVDASDINSAKTVDYVYDDLNRLISAIFSGAESRQKVYVENYIYNAIGNIFSGPQGLYRYDGSSGMSYANPHTPTSINGIEYIYDQAGNLLSDGVLKNTWNYKGQLFETTKDDMTFTYYYDQNGSRVRSEGGTSDIDFISKYYNIDSNEKETKNIYIGDKLVGTAETETVVIAPPRPICRIMEFKITEPIDSVSPVERTIERPTPIKESEERSCRLLPPTIGYRTTAYYNHTDHLNSVNVVTDEEGNKIELLDYYPFGSPRISDEDHVSQRQYIGEIYDTDTELNYLNARYYDGARGQFISQDPMFWNFDEAWLVDPQNQNSYSYARNNPISGSDPSGLLTIINPGTKYNKKEWSTEGKAKDFIDSVAKTFGETPVILNWSGGNSKEARLEAAQAELDIIKNHQFAEGEKLNIIGHSHGGNIGILVSQMTDRKIDNLVTLGTPVRSDYQPDYNMIDRHVNVYSSIDPAQPLGGEAFSTDKIGVGVNYLGTGYSYKLAGREFENAENVNVTWQAGGVGVHSNLWRYLGVWSKVDNLFSSSSW